MSKFSDEYLLSRQEYGELFPYVTDDDVSSIFWNGRTLWIDEVQGGSYPAKEVLSEEFVDRFVLMVCNRAGLRLGVATPTIHHKSRGVDMTLIHRSISSTGTSFILKKIYPVKRPEIKEILDNNICSEDDLRWLEEIVRTPKSTLIVGAGVDERLEFMRFLTRYIRSECRCVSVEYGAKLYLSELNQSKDVAELRVTAGSGLSDITALAVELDPDIIIYPEIKSEEIGRIWDEIPDDISVMAGMRCKSLDYMKNDIKLYDCFDIGIELARTDRSSDGNYHVERIVDFENTVFSEKVRT